MIQTYHSTLNVNKILSLTNLSGEEYVPIAIRTTTLGTLVTTSYYYEYVPIAIRTVQQEEQQKKRRRKRKKKKIQNTNQLGAMSSDLKNIFLSPEKWHNNHIKYAKAYLVN